MNKHQSATDQQEAKEVDQQKLELDASFALAEILAPLTKGELTVLRTNLGIKGVSNLKKQELAQTLAQHIPQALPELFHKMDETRYQILKQIAGQGGFTHTLLRPDQFAYFTNRGLLFSGTYQGDTAHYIPAEVLNAFHNLDFTDYRETFKRNAEWIKLVRGMLLYYGKLSHSEFETLLKKYAVPSGKNSNFMVVLGEALAFYTDMKSEANGLYSSLYLDNRLLNPLTNLDLMLYPFTAKQLQEAGEPGFVDRHASHKAFIEFIRKNYTITWEEADRIVQECVEALRLGRSTSQVLQMLQEQLELDDAELMRGFMGALGTLHNNTRQWLLKGYTPNELSPAAQPTAVTMQRAAVPVVQTEAAKVKVGRNDPCTCGSGKKYKKCCAS
ncbi:YecA family protein [Paenibacillus aestuarii]|uniref:YecA family protein n=1 Tax=Paenibacillus aestuarii TaxID=516965 RepID=A0ABW0KD74_9BACL|nr:SEC-C metal-binding domain-containing protein [Paenibacillus aestuarii]